ncbi:MAG: tetratricopeptide repeat protein, partial [Desulfatiglandales bacterium]
DLAPSSFLPHFRLGLLYGNMDEYDNALDMFNRVLTIRPDYAPAHLHLGALYLLKGELKRARHHLETAMDLDPSFEPSCLFLLRKLEREDPSSDHHP